MAVQTDGHATYMKMFQADLHSITLCADPSGRSLAGIMGSSSVGVCVSLVSVMLGSLPLADRSCTSPTECGVSEWS